ncbi:unnamed protein product [Miscanthus lutarioriparius]|uniref:DUF629 domain-containing protein n=1 Tax=Miscanthus lutarioriparius TaxID=422564 RepID=A0A811Q7C9_9POAL|nr:unnamed protein product [Miscanthus lutarioriparius]
MGRKSKKGGRSRKPPRPAGCPAPPPTNADWEDSTAAFRKEAESAIRAARSSHCHDDGCAAAAAGLTERHPASPLAHHILGHARASVDARAGDAVPPRRRARPRIAATRASALLYARRPGEALTECARALDDVADPTDPALHAADAAAGASRRAALVATTSPHARVAAARQRLLGVHADAEALEATGVRQATAPPVGVAAPTTKPLCCCRHATTRKAVTDDDLRGFLTVNLDDLRSYCDQTGGGGVHLLTCAVEFAKATKAWAYWLCPVCDMVFLDANSFVSHVEGEYIDELQELQPLMPKRAALDSEELQYSLKWTSFEMGEEDVERRKNLDRIKDVFSGLNTFKALSVGLVDKVKFARSRSKKPLPYCIPSCVTSLDSMEIQRLDKPLDQLYNHLSRGWEFVRILGDEGKNKEGRSDIISLVQDGTLLSLDAEKVASRTKDGSCEEDALFRWLLNFLEEDKLNNSAGEDSQDGGDKNAVNNGDGLDNLHEESLFEDKIPDIDSDMRFTISRTDECENSSLSQSDSSNFSTLEAESSSIDSGVGSVLHITAEGLLFLNVTLRALWHLREFHDRFLDMPLVLPHLTVEVHCIICLLRKTFKAWDNEKDYGGALQFYGSDDRRSALLFVTGGDALPSAAAFRYRPPRGRLRWSLLRLIPDSRTRATLSFRWSPWDPGGYSSLSSMRRVSAASSGFKNKESSLFEISRDVKDLFLGVQFVSSEAIISIIVRSQLEDELHVREGMNIASEIISTILETKLLQSRSSKSYFLSTSFIP